MITLAEVFLEKAKQIALEHAGVKVEDIHFDEQEKI